MTGNELISGMHQVLVEFFAKAPSEITGWTEIQPDIAWGHQAIAEAIAQRDAETMRALLRQHLQPLLNLG
jgi:DNA-binding FadR family transcriptional regulator